MKVFVEGGGDSRVLQGGARRAFRTLLEKANLSGRLPEVIACGGRSNAERDFRKAIEAGEDAILLLDSEGPKELSPSEDERKHWMVQVMESWFLTQPDKVAEYFGKGLSPESIAYSVERRDDRERQGLERDRRGIAGLPEMRQSPLSGKQTVGV